MFTVPSHKLFIIYYCLAQTRTGIGLLGKPPAVKQFPPSRANRRTRLLRDPRANAGMKRTSVVEHNLYFARARDRWINLAVKTYRVKTKLIIIIILHTIITTISILSLRSKQLRQLTLAHTE
jgi:hypothetical protein